MADPIKAMMDAIEAIPGISAYMPEGEFFRSRVPATKNPPYALVASEKTKDLIDTAVFDGEQLLWYEVLLEFWTRNPDDCTAWGNLVDQYVADYGQIDQTAPYTTVPGVQRRPLSFAEEQPRNSAAGLMNVCRLNLQFAVGYRPQNG